MTTGCFSEQAQEEISEDEYPLIMIHGLRVAESVHRLLAQKGTRVTDSSVKSLLNEVLAGYPARIHHRLPSELLVDEG